jgi:hypothetical protein
MQSAARGVGNKPRARAAFRLLLPPSMIEPPPGLFTGVGHNEQPVANVRGTNGRSGNTVPTRIVPARGQVLENSVDPPNKES